MPLSRSRVPSSLKVRDVMLREVPVTAPSESAGTAWDRMRALRVAHLLVLKEDHVVGTLARHDLSGPSGGAHRRMGRTVADLMEPAPVTIAPDATIARAATLMRKRRVACLPVVEKGRAVGMLTTYEMLGIIAQRA
jgi:CBS domain-containing protein